MNRIEYQCSKCGNKDKYQIINIDMITWFLSFTLLFVPMYIGFIVGFNFAIGGYNKFYNYFETYWQLVPIFCIFISLCIGKYFVK